MKSFAIIRTIGEGNAFRFRLFEFAKDAPREVEGVGCSFAETVIAALNLFDAEEEECKLTYGGKWFRASDLAELLMKEEAEEDG